MKNTKFTPATFVIDGDDAPIYANGIHYAAHNWNGFAVPFFDKATAQRLCKTFTPLPIAPNTFGVVFDETRNVVTQVEEDGTREDCGSVNVDGVTYYAVGNAWTWLVARHPFDQLAEELEEFCTAYNLPKMSADELAAEIREQLDDLIELQRNHEELAERIERAKNQLHFLNDFATRWDNIGK
jgi:hypothetical protein